MGLPSSGVDGQGTGRHCGGRGNGGLACSGVHKLEELGLRVRGLEGVAMEGGERGGEGGREGGELR
jgi:hypothetical protein